MTHRQQKFTPALRITATGSIALWLLAASCCSIGYLCSDDHHAKAGAPQTVAHHESDHSQKAESPEHEHSEGSHAHDSEQASGDSHPCDGGGDSCCSTLMATAQVAKPFNAAQPLLESFSWLCAVLQAHDQMPAAPETKQLRQAKERDLVRAPVVCLGRLTAASLLPLSLELNPARTRVRLIQRFRLPFVVGTRANVSFTIHARAERP